MDTSERIPLDIVTGFLGSGKTTLVNAVLRDPAFADTVVIVNEFGAVGLDQLLVGSVTDDVVLLDSGCLCCAASGSLRDTLIDLFSRRAARSLAPFHRVIVETSGLANPAPMVAGLLGDSALAPRCVLEQVLTLVDGVNGMATLERYAEAQRQVSLADRLLVSKADLIDAAQLATVEQALRRLNAHATVAAWRSGDAPGPNFAPPQALAPREVQPDAWLRGALRPQYAAEEPVHGAAFARVATHTLQVPETLSWPDYAAWTAELRRRFGMAMLRCKGLLAISGGNGGDDGPWVVQGVQGFFAKPYRLVRWPTGSPRGFLVCIGEGIAREELEDTRRSIVA